MRFPTKYITVYFLSFIILLTAWSVALYLTQQRTTLWNYLYNIAYALLYFSGGAISLYGFKKLGPQGSVGRELFSVSIGMFGYAMGLFIWSYYNLVLKIDTPYPSLADLFFLLYIPFLGYGIINLLVAFGVVLTKRIFFESSGIFITSAVIIFALVNPPDISPSLSVLEKILNVSYLLGDAFLITLGILLIRVTQGKIRQSFLFFIHALFSMSIADFLFAYRTSNNLYWNGDISDVLFALAGFLLSMGVIKALAVLSNISTSISATGKNK